MNAPPSPPWKPSHQGTFFSCLGPHLRDVEVPKGAQTCPSAFKMEPMTGRLSADSVVVFGTLSLPLVCRFRALVLDTLGVQKRSKAVKLSQTTDRLSPCHRPGQHFSGPEPILINLQTLKSGPRSGRPRAPKLIAMSAESLPPSGSDF